MKHLRASSDGGAVSGVDVIDAEADLCAACPSALRLVQREVQERAFGPGDRRMPSADPGITLTVLGALMFAMWRSSPNPFR